MRYVPVDMVKPKKPQTPVVDAFGNTWSDCVPVLAEDIASTEAAVGLKMPAELAKLFEGYAGGSPEWSFYESEENDIEVSIGYIIPLQQEGMRDALATVHQRIRKHQPTYPRDVFPFAYDNGHANLLCVKVETGEVVYWLHDDVDEPVRVVAGTLQEFLSGLAEPPF
ncbi:SMI1/KNR4 family protein [Myxococcus sp. K38C18041901]|uniref:SMI1/KNR4 family protein n=1 Tax=Myxococcus guangdongensis TaxID=2906760 RepID=UPI0020A79A94|nr:SMI1/KNR4 family protein [Myxococcus guangdongensis]MCP3059704.1 SMI1/KNR4 family protein [Myxococcus guangdongensis]